VLVDGPIYQRDGGEAFALLASQYQLSTVILTEVEATVHTSDHGVCIWLPRTLTISRPEILAAALEQGARLGELQRSQQYLTDALQQSQRQADRIAGLLWRTFPADAGLSWLSQQHVLERLREEVARAQRYGSPLTVGLGELWTGGQASGPESTMDWAAETVGRGKRGCDVAGQYGPGSFLLLLINTPAEGAVVCCRRLQRNLEQRETPPAPHPSIQVCFGLATASADQSTWQSLLRRAEENLETAKAGNGDRVVSG
jgi:diguanylate cyclase (GGDEF)-like protein